jgi:hypothetical protein
MDKYFSKPRFACFEKTVIQKRWASEIRMGLRLIALALVLCGCSSARTIAPGAYKSGHRSSRVVIRPDGTGEFSVRQTGPKGIVETPITWHLEDGKFHYSMLHNGEAYRQHVQAVRNITATSYEIWCCYENGESNPHEHEWTTWELEISPLTNSFPPP